MSIVLAQNLVLSDADDLALDHPVIGWKNIVTVSNIAADTEAVGYPVTNLANPATHLRWQAATTAEQYVTLTTGTADDGDYAAFAKHNFASQAIPISLERYDGVSWTELIAPFIPPTDGPVLMRYTPQPSMNLRLRLQAGSAAARMAVLYAGKLSILERKIYQGQTPLPHGRMSNVTNGRSESGHFLGRIVTGAWVKTKVPLSLISPGWYRDNLDPFLDAGKDNPFFFAWRPDDYPMEVGFAWLTNEPVPVNESPHGLIALSLEMVGVV